MLDFGYCRLIWVFNFIASSGDQSQSLPESLDAKLVENWGQIVRGKSYTPAEVAKIMSSFDLDGNGEISKQEWLEFHHQAIPPEFTVSHFHNSLTNYLPESMIQSISEGRCDGEALRLTG